MTTAIQARLRGEGGFTILELMIVLLIIGILLALGLSRFAPAVDAAKSLKAQANVRAALVDASAYYTVNGTYDGMVAGDLSDAPIDTAASDGAGENQAAEDPAVDCSDADNVTAGADSQVGFCADGDDFAAASEDNSGNVWQGSLEADDTIATVAKRS